MHARQPTYLESLLNRLIEPARAYLEANPEANPLSVITAHVLRADDPALPSIERILTNDQMLKAGRAYFALLLENDRLPRGEQLTLEELTLPRGLLLDFFQGQSDIQSRAQEVLGLVERKFSQRSFQQATILLQLFETDHTTKLQNERKLFYEDMIQRLGIRRRYPLSLQEVDQVQKHFAELGSALEESVLAVDESDARSVTELAMPLTPWEQSFEELKKTEAPPLTDSGGEADRSGSTVEVDGDTIEKALAEDPPNPREGDEGTLAALAKSCEWLAARHQISFAILGRHPEDFLRWHSVVRECGEEDRDEVMRFVPPRRWRAPSDFRDLDLLLLIAAYINVDSLKQYIETLTRACYFLLLAVGDTGLEAYLDTYFDWLDSELGIDGTTFIDRLHRESTFGEQTLAETLSAIYDETFVEAVAPRPSQLTTSELSRAITAFIQHMAETNFADVAPGHYNLGGMILDHLLGVQYPSNEFAFKIHRIV